MKKLLKPIPPFKVIVREVREEDWVSGLLSLGGSEDLCPNQGLIWSYEVPGSLAALAGHAFALVSNDHSWQRVADMAQAAFDLLQEVARTGSREKTEELRRFMKRVAPRQPFTGRFDQWEFIAMEGGAPLVLARELIWSVKHADVPERAVHPALPPGGVSGADIMAAYALARLDEAAQAWQANDAKAAFDCLADGSLAMSYSSMDEGNMLAAHAHFLRQRDSHKRLSAQGGKKRGQKADPHKAEALLLANSRQFETRAAAARYVVDRIEKSPGQYYTFDTIDAWLKDAGWRKKSDPKTNQE